MTTMTPERLEECLSVLAGVRRRSGDGPSDRAVARLLGRPVSWVVEYRNGTMPVPADLAEWLERRTAKRLASHAPVLPDRDKSRPWQRVKVSAEEAAAQAERLRAAMDALSWNAPYLASLVNKGPPAIRRWMLGTSKLPPPSDLVRWVEKVVRVGEDKAGPPPQLDSTWSDGQREAEGRATRLLCAMKALDWGLPEVAEQANRTYEGVRQWTLGKTTAPLEFVTWMEGLARDAASDPPPPWVLPGGVRTEDFQRGVNLLREAGLGRVAKLLERAVGDDELTPLPRASQKAEPAVPKSRKAATV